MIKSSTGDARASEVELSVDEPVSRSEVTGTKKTPSQGHDQAYKRSNTGGSSPRSPAKQGTAANDKRPAAKVKNSTTKDNGRAPREKSSPQRDKSYAPREKDTTQRDKSYVPKDNGRTPRDKRPAEKEMGERLNDLKAPNAEIKEDVPYVNMVEEYKMDARESIFVMPGDLIGTTEEFTAGTGTYVDVGDIHSIGTGYVHIDARSRTIHVSSKTKTPPQIIEGDVVVGTVVNIRESVVLVELGGIKDKGEREFQMDGPAAIHVSNVRDSFVKSLSQEFAMSDIVKARVINTQNMRLSTTEASMGVMRANCFKCRTLLEKDGDKLRCPSCGYIEKRKMSSDYGTGII